MRQLEIKILLLALSVGFSPKIAFFESPVALEYSLENHQGCDLHRTAAT